MQIRAHQLKLVKQIMPVNQRTTDFLSEYFDCLGELGLLPEKHHIPVNPEISPVIHSARRIPLALRGKVNIELDKMLKLGIRPLLVKSLFIVTCILNF